MENSTKALNQLRQAIEPGDNSTFTTIAYVSYVPEVLPKDEANIYGAFEATNPNRRVYTLTQSDHPSKVRTP